MSPLCTQNWGHIALPLSARSVSVCHSVQLGLWVCPPFISLQRFLSCRRSNTRRWPNAVLMLAHRLRLWANISPVEGHRVMFGATLNVGQRHRRRANINLALVQSIVPVPLACRYRPHEVLATTEWILASTGDAGPTFNKHWVGVGL